MTRLRIGFILVNANRREGTSRAVVEVAERLADRHEVTVVSRTNETLDTERVEWCRLPGPAWPDVAEFEFFRIKAESTLRKRKFDIIHSAGCNVWNADVYAIQTVHPRKMEINQRTMRNQNVSWLRRTSRMLYDARVVHSERKAYRARNSRGIVGYLPVSLGTNDELLSTYDLKGALIEVIPNGADLSRFSPASSARDRAVSRSELQCHDQDVVFLFAGGEWKRKGLQLAIEALSQAKNNRCILAVAGDDPSRSDYHLLAQQLGVSDRIRWLGFRNDIDRLYAAADVFLFPSAYEAFSLASIEAAASGLPVVMSDIPGARDLIEHGTNGFILERDARSYAQTMDLMAGDAEARISMGRAGRNRVERLFNWDRIAEQTEAFYLNLLEQRKHARN